MLHAFGLDQPVMWLAIGISLAIVVIVVLGLFAVARSSQISRAEEDHRHEV